MSVTVLITRRVRKGCAAEFERIMQGMVAAASRFPGHLGAHLVSPESASGNPLYQILFAFDTQAHLDAWSSSDERRSWLDRMGGVTLGDTSTRFLTGLEGWFALPSQPTRAPPPRHKMAFVTWLGIFPLVLLLSNLIAPWLAPIHPVLSVLVVTALVVVLMTWAVMPVLTRLFAGWLFASTSR